MPIRRPGGRARRVLALLLALLTTLALFGLFYAQTASPPPPLPKARVTRLHLGPRHRTKPPKPKPPPEERLRGQVVDIQEPERQERPDKARYLARYDSKVAKETKARPRPRRAQRPASKARPKAPTTKRAHERRPHRPRAQQSIARPKAARSILFRKDAPKPIRPTHSVEQLAQAAQALAQTEVYVSDDALLDVTEVADRTNLNARRFKYWDFFHRVREAVRRHWRPNEAYRLRDPAMRVYQRQNRLTVLRVVLDRNGRLIRATQIHKSGLPFLDEEALRAFAAAGPFENPPAGLVDERGRIEFSFGFYLEMDGSW